MTGTPARRLAMRATFSPCSASGIAQPMITSSISDGSRPGARRSASRDDGGTPSRPAARSAARRWAPCRRPCASRIRLLRRACEILQQILERVADFAGLTVEQMIGAVDFDELLRILQPRVELANGLERNELVVARRGR